MCTTNKINRTVKFYWTITFFVFFVSVSFLLRADKSYGQCSENAKYIILMIADGCGINHINATNDYTNSVPNYQTGTGGWVTHWMSTYPGFDSGNNPGEYDTTKAWSIFIYNSQNQTDSAASATALYTGNKTRNNNISVSEDDSTRFFSIGEKAKTLGLGVGAISTVPISHATPGAWTSHNDNRSNGYAISDEALFGDPNTTGTPASDIKYSGGHGQTFPTVDVLVGDRRSGYVNSAIRQQIIDDGIYRLVEAISGQNGGTNLKNAAAEAGVMKLAGLFDHVYHTANGSGAVIETPTLSDSTTAALTVLSRYPNGAVLMIEGGAVDWAGHANNMDDMIGEKIDFDNAVQTVINWVNAANGSSWSNTLLIVTADHECGYLTKGLNVFPDVALGVVNDANIAKEKVYENGPGDPIVPIGNGSRASWDDTNSNQKIDPGETTYWVWNGGGHTNTLVPLYARGPGADQFATHATGVDTVRGSYFDNTDVFTVMDCVLQNMPPTLTIVEPDGTGDVVTVGDSYNVTYDLADPDDVVTVALFYDTNNTGFNGTAIGGCSAAPEGIGVTCSWNTTGVTPGTYYVYGVTNDGANPDVKDYSPGQITINAVGNTPPTLSITEPNGTGDTVTVGDSYNVTYNLSDPDDVVTVALFYDTNNSGFNGTAIGGCSAGPEGTGVTCSWNTTGMAPGSYYVYGVTNDGTNPDVKDYSPGQITINAVGNTPPTLSITEPNGTGDTVTVGDSYDVTYDLVDPDDVVTVALFYDTNNSGFNGTPIGGCSAAPEGSGVTCSWNTTGMAPGSYYVYGVTNNGTNPDVKDYSPGQITINTSGGSNTLTIQPSTADSYIRDGASSGNNHGTQTSIWLKNAVSGFQRRGILGFDFSALDDTAVIESAYLDLYYFDNNIGVDPVGETVEVNRVTRTDWVEGEVTWNNYKNATPWTTAGGDFTVTDQATAIMPAAYGWVRWTVTDLIKYAQVNTSEIANVLLKFATTPNVGARFYSKEFTTDPSKQPKLIINYSTGNTPPTLSITEPDGNGDVITVGDSYDVTYDLVDPDDVVTVALFYDTNNSGFNGTAIGGCSAAPEGSGVTCSWNTTGIAPGLYYVYGVTNDGTNPDVKDYSPGQITINAVGNTPPTLSITEPDGTDDTVVVGDSYSVTYDLADPDDAVTVALFYDTNNSGFNGTAIGGCSAQPEGTGVTCSWNTTGVTLGSYYVYGVTNDGTNPDVKTYSPGQVTISSVGPATLTVQPSAADSYIRDGRSSGNNNGAQASIWLKNSIVGYNRRGILDFNFSVLDDTAVIESAYLDLYYFDNNIGVDPVGETVEVNRVTRTDWVEGEVTWNNYKNGSAWTTAGGDFTTTDQATAIMPAAYGWVRWTVTDQVKHAQSNTSEIAHMLIKFATAPNVGARFYSKEFTTDPSKQPKLIINYSTGNTPPTLNITEPDGTGDTIVVGDPYNVTYDLADPDDVVTVALFYDTDSTGFDGTAIGGCSLGSEGTGVACSWNTAGVATGFYYVYGVTNDGTNPDVKTYSPGQVTINSAGNTPPTLSIIEPDGTGDTITVGDLYNVTYDLFDPDNVVTAFFFYDNDNIGFDGTLIGGCTTAPEGAGVNCLWDTTGVTPGTYFVHGLVNDGTNPDVTAYSSGQVTINSVGPATLTVQPSASDTYIRDGASAGNNHGTQISIWLKNSIVGYNRRGILDFDFSTLDDTAVIESAYLDLYYFDNNIGVDPVGETVEVNRVTRTNWVEGEVTWNNYKNATPWTTAGGDFTVTDQATAIMPAAYGWVRWTVTEQVKFAQTNTSEIVNLLVKFASSASFNAGARVYTKEFTTDPSKQPKLIINYTTP